MSNTKNINVNVQRPPTNIPLGRQGENRATCVTFDCTGLVQLYGDGTAELLHELKDGTVYPVAATQEGASVSWTVSASDTATVGAGRAELRWYVGDTLAKSAKFRTSVSSALADTTTETPPAPQQSWVDKVLAAAQEIKDGAISDEKLAAAIAAYLEEHPIDAGLDEAALAAYLTENGYLTDEVLADAIAQALADVKASGQFDGEPGADGSPGADGADGVGIQSVVQTTTSADDGGTNVITVTKTDGTTSTFQVKNGSKGSDGVPGKDGANGADGKPGADGKSAYQYAQDGGYTGTEAEFAAKLAEEMPDALRNPNALTFTGAVTGSYDGSAPLSVEIPSGGGSGGSGSMQETVLASGVVATGTAQWHKENTGLTVADLQEWKLWGFVCLASSQKTTFAIYFGNNPVVKISSTGCKAILSWFDDDHNAINIVDLVMQDGFIKIDNSFFTVAGNHSRSSSLIVGLIGGYIPYVNNANDTVYIYTHDALTEDVAFKIVGLIK